MKTAKTFTAQIYVGLREGYSDSVATLQDVHSIIQRYTDETGFCVSVTETHFIYKNGSEPGAIIGVINYPRFESDEATLRAKALEIAEILKLELKQFRVSIVFGRDTVMLDDLGIRK
jgi:hypothetical protein